MKEYCFRRCYNKDESDGFMIVDTRLFSEDGKIYMTHKIDETDTGKVYENEKLCESNMKYDPYTGEKIV